MNARLLLALEIEYLGMNLIVKNFSASDSKDGMHVLKIV
jgi:hypothetical protein